MIEGLLTTFSGTASALIIFAIWSNSKFNSLEKDIAYIKGKLNLDQWQQLENYLSQMV